MLIADLVRLNQQFTFCWCLMQCENHVQKNVQKQVLIMVSYKGKNMKYFLITLLAVFLCVSVNNAQKRAKAKPEKTKITTTHSNKIDGITTVDDVVQFLKTLDPVYETFKVNTSLTFSERDIQALSKSLKAKAWVKADLDGNGYTDLLVIGSLNKVAVVLCVLDSGSNRFAVKQLPGKAGENCLFAIVKTEKGQPQITAYSIEAKKERSGKLARNPVKSVLCFQAGELIEYNQSPINHSIEKIEYSTTPCYGRCPVFSLVINADRSASLDAGKFNAKKGIFKATIDDESYKALITLLNYTNFTKLDSSYRVLRTDAQSCTLFITYDCGKVKRISDYGLKGTLGLVKVYDMLFKLRESQKWE